MSIENTSDRDPLVHLMGTISDGVSGYIEGMEAQGQASIVASSQLPAEAPWHLLEDLGVRRTTGSSSDPLFVDVELPEGWTRERSDHTMWSYVLDERGIRRISVFYKAAFYDRRATANLVSVGRDAARDLVYGDGTVALPAKWPLFTIHERADFTDELRGFVAVRLAGALSPDPQASRAVEALELVNSQ